MSAINSTRRNFLGGAALAGATAAAGAGPAIACAPMEPVLTASVAENHDLLEAYDRLKAALAERDEANLALEWIADEWRHLWPLAPEELLGGANAHSIGGNSYAERDIIGRYLMRDTSSLTKRFSPKLRMEMPTACFAVATEEQANENLDRWTKSAPKGRTEKALGRSRITRDRFIANARHKAALAREYEQETRRLRDAAGVEKARRRIMRAKASVKAICEEISLIPARSPEGFRIKAQAIGTSGILSSARECSGTLAEMARFIDEVAGFEGRASA
ncbi:secreted protein [Rhizobium sp. PP-F2F-G38]|nr:secreted protein [Rhizobium sp. PP-F2F-G38]